MTTPDVYERVAALLSGPRAREASQLERIRSALTFLGEHRHVALSGELFTMDLQAAIDHTRSYASRRFLAGELDGPDREALEQVIEAAGMYKDLCK